MKMVQDWKQAWKWFSVNCMAWTAMITAAWMAIPDELRASMPKNIEHWVAIALLTLGIVGRLIRQGAPDGVSSQKGD